VKVEKTYLEYSNLEDVSEVVDRGPALSSTFLQNLETNPILVIFVFPIATWLLQFPPSPNMYEDGDIAQEQFITADMPMEMRRVRKQFILQLWQRGNKFRFLPKTSSESNIH